MMDARERQARIDLAACYRLVARIGADDLIYNHISMRIPGQPDAFLINPYGMLFGEVTASSLVKIDLDGQKIDASPHPVNAAGFVIHSAVHAARPDAHCVLHVHSTAAVAVASQAGGLLPLSQFAMWFYERQGVHPYEGVALDPDEKIRLVRDLGTHPVLLLRNHGLLTVGQTPAEAFMMLYYFERAANIQLTLQASAMSGAAAEPISPAPETCRHASAQFWGQAGDIRRPGEREWPALLRQLDRDPIHQDFRT